MFRPLWLLYEDEIEAWRAAQPPLARRWLSEQNFKAEKHRIVLVPDANGGLAAAVGGLGKRLENCRCGTRRIDRAAARTPFPTCAEFPTTDATQLALDFPMGRIASNVTAHARTMLRALILP